MERVFESQFELGVNSLNWSYLYDADVFLSISGFDSGSGAHFHLESVQGFIYCNKIEHFTLMERVCESQFELMVLFH